MVSRVKGPVRAIVFVVTSALPALAQEVLDYPALLDRLVDPQWLYRPPVEGERCVQFSSYDRQSDKGPGNPHEWYANHDRGHYLRVDERDGNKEHVMVDVDGPGCLARLWSANPGGTLFFDVDGERVWTVDFAALCTGRVDGVPEPLAGMRSRGGNVYLPVPFQQHLTVSASDGDLYYLADVLRLPPGSRVPSFTPTMLATDPERTAAVAERLRKTGDMPTWL
jgi:hypothetical protein